MIFGPGKLKHRLLVIGPLGHLREFCRLRKSVCFFRGGAERWMDIEDTFAFGL